MSTGTYHLKTLQINCMAICATCSMRELRAARFSSSNSSWSMKLSSFSSSNREDSSNSDTAISTFLHVLSHTDLPPSFRRLIIRLKIALSHNRYSRRLLLPCNVMWHVMSRVWRRLSMKLYPVQTKREKRTLFQGTISWIFAWCVIAECLFNVQ